MKFKFIPLSQSDIFFAQSPSNKYLPWIIGLLIWFVLSLNVEIAVLTKAAVMSSNSVSNHYGFGKYEFLCMIISLIVLMTIIISFIIVFTIESQIKAHIDLIETLQLLGATPEYIVTQFQRYNQKLCIKGTVVGIMLTGFVGAYVVNCQYHVKYMDFINDYLAVVIIMALILLTLIVVSILSSQIMVGSALVTKNHKKF